MYQAFWVKDMLWRKNPRVWNLFLSITKAFPIIVVLDRHNDWTGDLLMLFLTELGLKARSGTFIELNEDWSLVLSVYSHEKIDSLYLQASVEDAVFRADQIVEAIMIILAATSTSTRLNMFGRELMADKWPDITVEQTRDFAHSFRFALIKFAESVHVLDEFHAQRRTHEPQRRNIYP